MIEDKVHFALRFFEKRLFFSITQTLNLSPLISFSNVDELMALLIVMMISIIPVFLEIK